MMRSVGLALGLTAGWIASVAAQTVTLTYGSPLGCAGQQPVTNPYLFYDGKKLILNAEVCTLTPPVNNRTTATCEGGPQGKYTEVFTLILVDTSVQIFRESGARLVGLPACPK